MKVPQNQQRNEGSWDAASAGNRRRREKLNKVNHRRDLQTLRVRERDDRYVQNERRLPSTNIYIWRELWDFTPSEIFHSVWYTSQTSVFKFEHVTFFPNDLGNIFCCRSVRIISNIRMRDGFGRVRVSPERLTSWRERWCYRSGKHSDRQSSDT